MSAGGVTDGKTSGGSMLRNRRARVTLTNEIAEALGYKGRPSRSISVGSADSRRFEDREIT